MIAIVSPAKNMRTAGLKGLELTRPALLEKTRRLLPMLRALEPWELESRLKINPQLAMKAFSDFQEFESPGGESPALLSYHGLAYQNLEAESLGLEDFAFAGGSLRILSAFYGVLRRRDQALSPGISMRIPAWRKKPLPFLGRFYLPGAVPKWGYGDQFGVQGVFQNRFSLFKDRGSDDYL